MTIIQAQPLKQFGISGPASALDNEIAVFDGVTGKKIKAATGIICPSSGRLDLDELGNSDGDLKLQEDAQGNVVLFDGADVGDAVNGKSLMVYRKAAEGDCYFDFKIKDNKVGQWYLDGISAFEFKGGRFDFVNHIRFGTNYGTDNYSIYHYGYLTDVAAQKYIQWQVDDTADNFELSRQDDSINYFDIQMPVIMTGGNVGIVTIDPTAKLDIDSDILRLRTAKTPSSAGDIGNQGDMCWDADYHYRCVATNTWKRTALTTW